MNVNKKLDYPENITMIFLSLKIQFIIADINYIPSSFAVT